jgi:hypothetical protein
MVRVLALCLSVALICLGVVGIWSPLPRWLVGLDFAAGALGILLDFVLWKTYGRYSVAVSLVMALALVAIVFGGMVTNATSWLTWCMLGIAAAFVLIAAARGKEGYSAGEDL